MIGMVRQLRRTSDKKFLAYNAETAWLSIDDDQAVSCNVPQFQASPRGLEPLTSWTATRLGGWLSWSPLGAVFGVCYAVSGWLTSLRSVLKSGAPPSDMMSFCMDCGAFAALAARGATMRFAFPGPSHNYFLWDVTSVRAGLDKTRAALLDGHCSASMAFCSAAMPASSSGVTAAMPAGSNVLIAVA